MFYVNNIKQLKAELSRTEQGWEDTDLVWRGDDGSFILATPGEFEAKADEDDDALYVLGGVVSDYRRDVAQ